MNKQEEFEIKVARVRAWLSTAGLEAVFLSSQTNFAWLTGGGNNYVFVGDASGEASVIVSLERVYLLTNNIELPRLLDEEVAELSIETVIWKWYQSGEAQGRAGQLCNLSRAASDTGFLGLPMAPDSFNPLRYTLLPSEVQRYRELGADAARAVEAACHNATPGRTELEIAAALALECQKRNILPLVNLVAGDERIARYRHPLPTENKIRRTMMVVLTGRRAGLHASLTRMVSFGKSDSELEARYKAAATVDARLILESRPGVALGEAMLQGIDQYAQEGFDGEWELHHQGGLTGYAGREIFATPRAKFRMQANQAVAWNPSITGAKSEDTALITDDGPHVITISGAWPEMKIELPGGDFNRPTILVK